MANPNGRMPTTHQHVLHVLARELATRKFNAAVRILDAGCGDCRLIAQLEEGLPRLAAGHAYQVYGFDSAEYGFIGGEVLEASRAWLASRNAAVDWSDRVRPADNDGGWPFDDNAFDIVVSNQVLEHVVDLQQFFAECARVLRPGGFAVHVFPLRSTLVEVHLMLPLVHWVNDHDSRVRLIAWMSRIGLGKYRSEAKPRNVGLDAFAREHSDYVWFFTRYRQWREVSGLARLAGFRASYKYTSGLYLRRLLHVFGRQSPLALTFPHPLEMVAFPFLRMAASVTVLLEREQTYRPGWKDAQALTRTSPTAASSSENT